jgi:hypothetical protein
MQGFLKYHAKPISCTLLFALKSRIQVTDRNFYQEIILTVMKNKRQLYRVLMKSMAFIGIAILLGVMVNSLFIPSEKTKAHAISVQSVSLVGLQPGKIKRTRWNNKDVSILYRPDSLLNFDRTFSGLNDTGLNKELRSVRPEYFVFFNYAGAANCPLRYTGDGLKDICSGLEYDLTGRPLSGSGSGEMVKIVPHYYDQNGNLILGQWEGR